MSKERARGRLDGDHVTVPDPAQAARLHGKGTLGELLGDNRLRLGIVEAAWLVADGKLDVDSRGRSAMVADLLALSGDGRKEVDFLVFADLRSRGLLVRPSGAGWAVWPRGAAPSTPPDYQVEAVAERDVAAADHLMAWADRRAVLAVVDEDGAVTYYRATAAEPTGSVPHADLTPFTGTILSDRVLASSTEAARAARREHVGVTTSAGLALSFTEAEALRRRGVLDVPATLATRAAAVQPHFRHALPVYEALRAAGVVAKSGFKFGTHLRGYRGDPDASHADWLVHCLARDGKVPWADLARGIRVAHGVRKAFLVAVAADPVRFVQLSWFKP